MRYWPPRDDAIAVECARIAVAFECLLSAALAQLVMHYGSRLCAINLCARPGNTAALAALRQERDAALAALRATIGAQKRQALATARAKRWRRRRYRPARHNSQPNPPFRPRLILRPTPGHPYPA